MTILRALLIALCALGGCAPETAAPTDETESATGRDTAPDPTQSTPPPTEQRPPDPNPPYANQGVATPQIDGVAIVARDPITGDLGAAIVSRTPGAGLYSHDARADAGVAVTLGNSGGAWRDQALDLLGDGKAPADVVRQLVDSVSNARTRPVMVMNPTGSVASYAHSLGKTASFDGEGVGAICFEARAFTILDQLAAHVNAEPHADLPLVDRLFVTLREASQTGQLANIRPPRSAAILIVRPKGGPFGRSDRIVDVRADYHGDPIARLEQLTRVHLTAYTAPALRRLQKSLRDTKSELYKSNAAWLKRIQLRVPLGETDR